MKLYLVGIKSYQLHLGIDWTAFSDPRLDRTLHRIKQDHNISKNNTLCSVRSVHLTHLTPER